MSATVLSVDLEALKGLLSYTRPYPKSERILIIPQAALVPSILPKLELPAPADFVSEPPDNALLWTEGNITGRREI
jgi:hypothetical protein